MVIAIIVAAVVIITGNREHNEQISELDRLNELLANEGNKLEGTIDNLEGTIGNLQLDKTQLQNLVVALNDQVATLEAQLESQKNSYSTQAANLRKQIADMKAEIAALEADIERYQTVYSIDVLAQARLIEDVITYIETMCPYVRMVDVPEEEPEENLESSDDIDDTDDTTDTEDSADTEKIDETEAAAEPEEPEEIVYKWVAVADLIEEEKLKAEEAEEDIFYTEEELEEMEMTEEQYQAYLTELLRPRVLAREDVFYPSVSVYYEDLVTGYSFEYAADDLYDAASVVKAPYILSVLQTISADEKSFFEKVAAEEIEPEMIDTDEDGTPDTIKIAYSDPNYDLSEKVIYTKDEMYKNGSGKIKDMEDGTEFTYLDFIKYALEYSDNVAYQALRTRFGYQTLNTLAWKVKANSVLKAGNLMSAADAGKLFKAIYEFVEEDETYGPIMKESMLKGNHTVIVPYGVYPTKTLHKYGWDIGAYHDVGIVLHNDKPFIMSVFSDLDNGGTEVNAYLCNIVRMIYKLHKGFYQ